MSETNGNPLDPVELASLPAQDPRRQAFALKMAGLPAEQRERWEAEFALTDRLRRDLADVEIPADLQSRLLAIPQPAAGAKSKPFRILGLNARAAAAIVILAGLAAYYLLFMRTSTPVYLEAAVAKNIATLAVQQQPVTPAVASSNVDAVKKALESGGVDVPVIMLTPADGTILEGGGTCDFGGTKAAYTQWKYGEARYTLYEFNGKKLGAPANFFSAYQQAAAPTGKTPQVFIFPGSKGKCCWALVMDSENAKNVFSQYGSAY